MLKTIANFSWIPSSERCLAYLLLLTAAFALFYENFNAMNQVRLNASALSAAAIQLTEQKMALALERRARSLSEEALFDPELLAYLRTSESVGDFPQGLEERHPIVAGFFLIQNGDVELLGSGRPHSELIAGQVQSPILLQHTPGIPFSRIIQAGDGDSSDLTVY